MNKPTRVPDITWHYTDHLDIFLASCSDSCSVEVLPTLGFSVHSLINVKIHVKSKASPNVSFHRTIFRYAKSYIVEAIFLAHCKNIIPRTVPLNFELILN